MTVLHVCDVQKISDFIQRVVFFSIFYHEKRLSDEKYSSTSFMRGDIQSVHMHSCASAGFVRSFILS